MEEAAMEVRNEDDMRFCDAEMKDGRIKLISKNRNRSCDIDLRRMVGQLKERFGKDVVKDNLTE